ncbi:PAS domain-containing sensor histidine kinase [Caulobacter sp. NIBR1757]|uniref:PAS domain-containing sensor histidine kinase n=1 Tax=Caulobacter sp. NIBR1757 TaxID=3016000 RepID=UPI0022F02842|nr:PAS domain-containing sensor histidine kinase [Caulobacter sp. NIBR1757]WGM38336.1 Adaptive-response sensory-kinase SasA [Caulobacter sp. NIBR1757]
MSYWRPMIRKGLYGPPLAALIAAIALAPAFAFPMVSHSGYLFGIAAILVGRALIGTAGTVSAGVVVTIVAPLLDRRAGIPIGEGITRFLLFVAIAFAITYWTERIRRYELASAAGIGELAGREAVLRSILDTGPDAMLTMDARGVVTRFSAAAEKMFGWRPGEVVGHNVSMLMPEPYQGEHDGYIERYLRTGDRQIIGKSREVIGQRKDGSTFPMMLHVGEFRVGESLEFTGFVHDLTALAGAKAQGEELRNQLSHVWRMNSLGEMAAVLAHELNQPLSAISNYMRGARNIVTASETPDEDLITAVDQAGAQALRAGEIIRRMRAMLARDTDARTPQSLRDLIVEMDALVAIMARDSDARVAYELTEGEDIVAVDRIQIQQVIGNLVRNALEAMKDQAIRRVEVVSLRDGDRMVVRIEDSGPGLGDKSPETLFEPLVSTKSQGMGLGLSISRAILADHDGTIWVEESRLGGVAFCFSLPSSAQ